LTIGSVFHAKKIHTDRRDCPVALRANARRKKLKKIGASSKLNTGIFPAG